MKYFTTGRTIELEKEVGTIFKKKIKKTVRVVSNNDKIISDPKNVNAITKRIRENFEIHDDESIKRWLFHTFPAPHFDNEAKRVFVISPTEYDYTALNNFFSLIGAIIGAQSKDNPKNISNKLTKAFFESWNILRERGYLQQYTEIIPERKIEDNKQHILAALLHPPWEKLKNDKQFLDVVLNTYSKHTGIPREKIEQHLDDIIKAVDAVTEAAMKHDDLADLIERGEIPELERVLYIFAGKKPEDVQPAKFKQVQKQEEKPRTRGLPEDTKLEVLSILQALEFADYSESAKEKALGKLASMLEELSKEELTAENLQKIGFIAFAVEIIKRGEFRRVEEIKKL